MIREVWERGERLRGWKGKEEDKKGHRREGQGRGGEVKSGEKDRKGRDTLKMRKEIIRVG